MNKSQYTEELIARALIADIEKKDSPKNIETKIFSDYKTPQRIIWKEKKTGYVPDIKATFSKGVTNIYTIELTGEFNIEKWRLFSLYARQNKGGLFIIAPESRLKEIKDKVKESHINNVHLIYIPGNK